MKGRTYLCIGEYEPALSCFFKWKTAIEEIPVEDTSPDADKKRKRYEYANFLIGDCYLKTRKYDEARRYFEVALAKEHEEIILSLEALCELEYESGNPEKCLSACERLFERDSRSYIGYDYMSKAYYKMGYANEAINCCEHAIAIYPYVAEPYALEIKIFIRLEKIDFARNILGRFREYGIESDRIDYAEAQILEAEGKYEDAITLLVGTINRGDSLESDMKDYWDLYMMLAGLYERVEKNDEAISLYERIIKQEPAHWGAYGRLGILYRDKDRIDDALSMLTTQLEIMPSGYYYIQRAIIYKHIGKLEEAKADYIEALEDGTDNYFCYSRIALIYELEGEYNKAIEHLEKALEIVADDDTQKNKHADIIATRARILQCMKAFEESQKYYEKYIEMFGLNPDVVYDYSELLLRMNCYDLAAGILNRCIEECEYSSDVQMCIRQLIYVYGTEGYIDKANEALELAISKDSKDARAYGSLANIFRNRGMYKEAKGLYEKAIKVSKNTPSDERNNYYLEYAEVIVLEKKLIKPNVEAYLKNGYSEFMEEGTPFTQLKLLSGKKAERKYEEAIRLAEKALNNRRCLGCFYCECHEAWFEKGVVLELLKKYELALDCYRKALSIVGHNAIYEEKIRRLEKKER